MAERATHAFVGLRACGHAEFLYVDLPDREGFEERDSMLEGIVECLRAGGSIKRITIAEARGTPLYCKCQEVPGG